jgi:hypothetical protein
MSRSSAARISRRLKSNALRKLSGWCASCGRRVESAPPNIFIPFKGSSLERYGRGIYVLCRFCRETTGEARANVMRAVEQRIEFGRAGTA